MKETPHKNFGKSLCNYENNLYNLKKKTKKCFFSFLFKINN